MKTYRLVFENLTTVSVLPDAQKIFGAVCTIIKHTQGEEALSKYLSSFDEEPLFVHSSMFPCDLLPMPKVSLFSVKERNSSVMDLKPEEQLNYLSRQKKFKKARYITEKLYSAYFVSGSIDSLKNDIISNRISVNDGVLGDGKTSFAYASDLIGHNNRSTDENERKLFYERNTYFDHGTKFAVYVKTDDIDAVKDIFRYSEFFGFGTKASAGKNCFRLTDVEEVKVKNDSERCLLLSKCISADEFSNDDSNYGIHSSSYISAGNGKSRPVGTISKYVEGSYMKPHERKEYYGTVIKIDDSIYHYGIGFVL